jgi:hypothetical protein
MALAIATNNAALRAAASASSVNRDMETSMARLSTGKRINAAQQQINQIHRQPSNPQNTKFSHNSTQGFRVVHCIYLVM